MSGTPDEIAARQYLWSLDYGQLVLEEQRECLQELLARAALPDDDPLVVRCREVISRDLQPNRVKR